MSASVMEEVGREELQSCPHSCTLHGIHDRGTTRLHLSRIRVSRYRNYDELWSELETELETESVSEAETHYHREKEVLKPRPSSRLTASSPPYIPVTSLYTCTLLSSKLTPKPASTLTRV